MARYRVAERFADWIAEHFLALLLGVVLVAAAVFVASVATNA